jgi:predicted transcriptional regulator
METQAALHFALVYRWRRSCYSHRIAKPKKFDPENPAPVVDDEDEETLAAIDEGMRDAEAGRTVPAEEVRRLRAEVRQTDRQVKSGHYIMHEDLKAWLLSLGTDPELPAPKCACGSSEC